MCESRTILSTPATRSWFTSVWISPASMSSWASVGVASNSEGSGTTAPGEAMSPSVGVVAPTMPKRSPSCSTMVEEVTTPPRGACAPGASSGPMKASGPKSRLLDR